MAAAAAPAGGGGGAQEGVGESSSPPRGPAPAPSASGGGGRGGRAGGGGLRDVCREVYERLVADGHAETLAPDLRARLQAHFARLPIRSSASMLTLRSGGMFVGCSGMLCAGTEMVGEPLAIEMEFVEFASACARISLSCSLICRFRGCRNQRIRDGMTNSFCALVV